MLILLNNKFAKTAKVDITGNVGRGFGVFETLRTFDKEISQKKEHIERLFSSANKIGMKMLYKKSEISNMLDKIAQKSNFKNQRIKVIAIPEALIITSDKLKIDPQIYKKGISLKSIIRQRGFPEIKSISYLPSFLSHQEAVKQGYFEALLIDKNDEVYECAYHNLFWFEGKTLYTRKEDVLPGTIAKLIEKKSPFPVKYKKIKLKELLKKNEIFITNSLNLIVPVTKIDKIKISKNKPGTKTIQLIQTLFPSTIEKK